MYIDFHNHLDFHKKEKLNDAIDDINTNRINTIACSMDINSYLYNLELSKQSKYIIPAFGIHPWRAYENINQLSEIEKYIKYTTIIGEIGLDFYWIKDKSTYLAQIEVFKYFLKLAKNYNKYLNIHTKGAEDIVLDLIKKYDISSQCIIHWYSGDRYTLKSMIDMNCYFTASVDVGYSNLAKEIIELIPYKNLLAETDGPTALEWVNGAYGMPSDIKYVYKNICKIKKIDIDMFKESCMLNLAKIIQ